MSLTQFPQICNYIKQRSREFQCIVISLKDMFFEHADCLVGVCKDVETLSSQLLSLDLSGYDEGSMDLPEHAVASPSPVSSAGTKSPAGSSSEKNSKSEMLGKRKVAVKQSRRTKLASVGEEEEKFLVEGEEDDD